MTSLTIFTFITIALSCFAVHTRFIPGSKLLHNTLILYPPTHPSHRPHPMVPVSPLLSYYTSSLFHHSFPCPQPPISSHPPPSHLRAPPLAPTTPTTALATEKPIPTPGRLDRPIIPRHTPIHRSQINSHSVLIARRWFFFACGAGRICRCCVVVCVASGCVWCECRWRWGWLVWLVWL